MTGKFFRAAFPGVLLAGLWLSAAFACAATSTTWEMNNYQDFLRGRLTGVSLSRDGRLSLAPKLEPVFTSTQPEIWSVAAAADGSLYLGTGNGGRVYKVDASGHGAVYWTSDQPEVFAVTLDAQGVLYAATSPDGKVYRIENGKASEYFAPKEKYIWALAFSSDGALYVGTGDRGRIYRVTGPGQGELYYDTGQSNITCLAFDAQGRLLAGSEPNGLLYRVTAKNKAFVLYDSNLPEIRTILPQADGTIYAAALGGSIAKRTSGIATSSAAGAPVMVSLTATSVTVTDSTAQSGIEIKPKPDASKTQSTVVQTAAPPAAAVEYPGIDKSAVYKIHADNTVETLWSSKDENIYDLFVNGGQLLFATDERGRIYRLNPDRNATLLTETGQGETTRLVEWRGGIAAATGNMGVLYRLERGVGATGTYESPVHDTGTVARWGRLNWRATPAPGARLAFVTRTGNSARPDATWSDWSTPVRDPAAARIQSPNARYIQWRAEFSGPGGVTPGLDSVSVAYLPQNNPPVVRGVTVVTQSVPSSSAQKASSAAASASYSVTVTDTGEPAGSTAAGTPTQMLSRGASQQTQIVWQADDPDGDKLVYAVYFRAEEQHEWILLKSNLYENTYTIDADALADGRYDFRVVASDSPSNPPLSARQSEAVSAPVLIDNTPPVVTL
ncbi:MAG: PQQ-binding-like beta-propeller repeat protein, partial [Bryobacteraceae bacterium]